MKLTDEQKTAVRCEDNVLLTACPGSGKTRVIISKLLRTVEAVRGTPRAVACITYTNAAVQEIEARLRRHIQIGDDAYFDVCTIHSFCLNHIFRPFCHRVPGYKNGFKVLTQDSDTFVEIVTAVCGEYGRYNLRFSDFDEFAQLQISAAGEPVGASIESGGVRPEEASLYWRRMRSAGYVDFCSILYFSLVLLRSYPEIVDYVASRFAWILVDEMQDTSDLQVEVLSMIAARNRTRFFLVGDPLQSVFGFAGARPDLANVFAARIKARTDCALSGNFRSSPPVIAHAERLIPRAPPMRAVGPAKVFTEVPEHHHGRTAFDVITDYFLPAIEGLRLPLGEAAILAPTWFSLFPLGRQLRAYGTPVVGPGARPYRRNRVFAPLAEHVCGFLVEPDPEAIPGIERAIFNMVLDMTGRPRFDLLSYTGRVVVFRLLAEARSLASKHMGAIAWLEAAAPAFADILIQSECLTASEAAPLVASVEEMKRDMTANRVDQAQMTLEDLGVYANPKSALKLSTLHNAKGREYDAAAIIDLHEGRIPFYKARTDDEIAAARRLFYVGITRARRYLLYVTDVSDRRNVPTRFLRGNGGLGLC